MDKNTDSTVCKLREKPLLSVNDLQKILCIGRASTYAFLHNDPPFRIIHINGTIRIPSKDVFDWIDGNKNSLYE